MIDKMALTGLGLTNHEITVYLALLEINESSASKLAEKIRLNRTHTYDILESLISRGFVSYIIKNNRKYFKATHPNRLLESIKEKEKDLKQQEENIKQLIPQLLSLRQPTEEKTKVEIFHGKEGIKTVYNDILKKVKEYYVLGATGRIAEIMQFYFPHHEKERIKKRIKLKLLFNESARTKDIATKREYAEIRFLPPEYFSPVPTTIYNNRVITLIWAEPLAIVVDNKEVASTYRKYFDLLWKISKE